jgi:hypothetical protein
MHVQTPGYRPVVTESASRSDLLRSNPVNLVDPAPCKRLAGSTTPHRLESLRASVGHLAHPATTRAITPSRPKIAGSNAAAVTMRSYRFQSFAGIGCSSSSSFAVMASRKAATACDASFCFFSISE